MSVHKKLMQARIKLQTTKLTKSGHNKFAGYRYFELGDFLPVVQEIFDELNLCGVVSYATDTATLTITDTESNTSLCITSPMSTAALKGCHEVQNLGAVQTYIRRYLWVTALEIVEHDALDATTGASEPAKPAKTVKPDNPSEWQIVVGESDNWSADVVAKTSALLEKSKSKDDLLQIFKVNRPVFEKLLQNDKATYDDLMAVFSEYKSKFGE